MVVGVLEGAARLRRLEDAFAPRGADIAILLEEVDDPPQHGIVDGPDPGGGIVDIRAVHEKLARLPSRRAIAAACMLGPSTSGWRNAAAARH